MNGESGDAEYDRWWDETPESKLELIDGKLVFSTLKGSRRILWMLLDDYGPDLFLPMAPAGLWWAALREAYDPRPEPRSRADWMRWADGFAHRVDAAPAGPHGSSKHRRVLRVLRSGFDHFVSMVHTGRHLGPDFVIRLGENALTPDLLFANRACCSNLYDLYLEGPPTLVVEALLPGSADQDRGVKRGLYEKAGIPEYWLVDPENLCVTFNRRQADGRYEPLRFGPEELARITSRETDVVYDSVAVPGLSLSLLDLWALDDRDRDEPWRPFRRTGHRPDKQPNLEFRDDGIGSDTVPFAPRADLRPTPIRFDEFISWCGRAKLESYGDGLKIDGSEGTRRVAGMLLMTFGLIETVKLAAPREWVMFLERDAFRETVEPKVETIMRAAEIERSSVAGDEPYYWGQISGRFDLSGGGESAEQCRRDLQQTVRTWVLLRSARRQDLSDSS